jgi:hypothetical protein
MSDWTDDIDAVLDAIRLNCIVLSKRHKTRYFDLKYSLNFYKLPVIVLNGCNSIISVGLQPYATQGTISLTTSLIALLCGIIGSIELFLGIQKRLESDLISGRDYYLLSIDIFKTLSLNRENRPIPAKDYLNEIYNHYTKLIESSEALVKKIDDKLHVIDIKKKEKDAKPPPSNKDADINAITTPSSDKDDDSDDIVVLTPRPTGRIDLPHRGVELTISDND